LGGEIDGFARTRQKSAGDQEVMFHWAKHGQNNKKDMRADTGTYQWVAECARAAISNPYALIRGKKAYQIICVS